jgi:hypothetical protein
MGSCKDYPKRINDAIIMALIQAAAMILVEVIKHL